MRLALLQRIVAITDVFLYEIVKFLKNADNS